jgi:phospho-N-acetylmuramoyl-pentapeptide-transferase
MAGIFLKEQFFFARLLGASLTAFGFSIGLGHYWIPYLSKWQANVPVRANLPKRHLTKNGTPTLGGLLIVIAYSASIIIWSPLNHPMVRITLFTLIGFSAIGLYDDLLKINGLSYSGLSARTKYSLQSLLGLFVSILMGQCFLIPQNILIGKFAIPLGGWWIIWAYGVIVGSSNAFNLTDGLDGLAGSQVIITTLGLILLTRFLHNTSIPLEELAILCSALIGSTFGFLCYNLHPALIFMGDVGALALGAYLGTVALILHQEIAFGMMAFVPLVETISVILQVVSFKLTKQRLFRMAPFHHHLELLGKPEPTIVIQLGLVAIIMVSAGLYYIWVYA